MKRLFLLAILTLSVALVTAFPGSTAQAASGSIVSVCGSGLSVNVVLSVTGSQGDIIGVQVNGAAISQVAVLSSSGTFTFTYSTTLGAGSGPTVTVQAGNLDSSGHAFGNGFNSSTYYTLGSCVSGSGGPAPIGYGNGGTTGIPAGFVQRGINCTVAVYSQVDGVPVGSNTVLKGQNWYVNPVPVKGKLKKLWTEIYLSGPVTAYIPTKCVLSHAFP